MTSLSIPSPCSVSVPSVVHKPLKNTKSLKIVLKKTNIPGISDNVVIGDQEYVFDEFVAPLIENPVHTPAVLAPPAIFQPMPQNPAPVFVPAVPAVDTFCTMTSYAPVVSLGSEDPSSDDSFSDDDSYEGDFSNTSGYFMSDFSRVSSHDDPDSTYVPSDFGSGDEY